MNMAADRTRSWLQAEKTDNKYLPESTSAQQAAATSPTGSIEFVPASVSIPTDINIGEPTCLSKSIASVLEGSSETVPREAKSHPRYIQPNVKLSASSELLKISNLDYYFAACGEYSRGLAANWSEERLLVIISRWRALDNEEKE